MNLNKFVSGKVSLNQYANRLTQDGASFHIHYWGVMPKHFDTRMHKHSFFEICYVVSGQGTYIDNDCTFSLQENTVFFSRPDVLHQIKSEGGLFLLYVGFELIESESSEKWRKTMKEAKQCSDVTKYLKDDSTTALLWKSLLVQATKTEQAFYQELLTNLAYSLVLSLLQKFIPYSNNDIHKPLVGTSSTLLSEAKLYIKDNLSQSLKITDVANHLHISSRHLSRIFVSELGVNYSEFVQSKKTQEAATLLKTTDFSIKSIAEVTGFTSVHYFTRVFSTVLGISPGRFRTLYMDLNTTTFKNG